MWRFTWQSGKIKGCSDIFPDSEFENEVTGAIRTHDVEYPDLSRSQARYTANVSGSIAELDYTAHREFNESHDMEVGFYIIHFADSSRSSVKDVRWRWGKRPQEVAADVEAVFLP